jgi:hypothetical protein
MAPDRVGNWSDFHFEADLSRNITAAFQYRVQLIADTVWEWPCKEYGHACCQYDHQPERLWRRHA